MRTITLGLICLPFLISCSGQENAQIVFSKDSDIYKIEIATIQTKINSNGVAQCSKYTKTTRNDTVYNSYGLSLPKILAYSLKTSEKYLGEFPIDSLEKQYLKVRIENYSDHSLNYDSLLYLGLSEAFNLKANAHSRTVGGYRLNVIDHSVLQRFEVDCGASMIKYNNGVFSGEAIPLKDLIAVIDQHVEPPLYRDTTHGHCYAIDFIVDKDFEKINDRLKQYGLQFDPAEFEQTFYRIGLTTVQQADELKNTPDLHVSCFLPTPFQLAFDTHFPQSFY